MSNQFKKFIETSGKSLDEIRRFAEELAYEKNEKIAPENGIREKISQTINEARETSEKYPRTDILPDEIAYPHESLSDNMSEHDREMTEKISEMRLQRQLSYNGYIVMRCAEVTFVMQGDFMADAEDDFPRSAFCGMTTPMYASMSNSQLRTYFTWRADVRRGVYNHTDKAYVLLYVFELLNRIGTLSAEDAFGRLLDLWDNMKSEKYLDELLPRWLKDFYAFNDITKNYPDINEFLCGDKELPDKNISDILCGNFDGKLDFLADNSAYDIRKSSFLTKEREPLFEGALKYVLKALDEYLGARELSLSSLLCGQMKTDYSWKPFDGAIVNLDRTDGFRGVRISAAERYCQKRGEPALERFMFFPCRGFIGFVLKATEAALRQKTGYGRKITPNKNMLLADVKNREKLTAAVESAQFTAAIENAVDEFCRKNHIAPKKKQSIFDETVSYERGNIEIDVSRLQKIRENAEETARKLIIDEEEAPFEERLEELAGKISDDEFDERITEYKTLADEDEGADFSELPDEWKSFAEGLDALQRNLLKALLEGNAEGFCREKNILPETIFEEINEKAMNTVLDIVIENGVIIADYIEFIEKAARRV